MNLLRVLHLIILLPFLAACFSAVDNDQGPNAEEQSALEREAVQTIENQEAQLVLSAKEIRHQDEVLLSQQDAKQAALLEQSLLVEAEREKVTAEQELLEDAKRQQEAIAVKD